MRDRECEATADVRRERERVRAGRGGDQNFSPLPLQSKCQANTRKFKDFKSDDDGDDGRGKTIR